MGLQKSSLSVFGFFFIFIFSFFSLAISHSQNIPHEDYLTPHNKARAEVGSPALKWNDTLAAYAQKYANSRIGDCKLEHSKGSPYGENIAEGFGYDFPVGDAVNSWVDEKKFYDEDSNSCKGGECRHYTQVVWANTFQVGCAKVKCDNGWWFVTCNYYPPGNYEGDYPY